MDTSYNNNNNYLSDDHQENNNNNNNYYNKNNNEIKKSKISDYDKNKNSEETLKENNSTIFIDIDNNSTINSLVDKSGEFPISVKELKFGKFIGKISAIAFPAMLFYLFVILMQTINLIFIGLKYNSKEMAESISASSLYMNCTLFAITMGLISGMDTLCSNAYAVKKYYLMGLYVHRARIITYSFTICIVIIHIFTAKYVLNLFRLSEKVKSDAILYTYYTLAYAFLDVQSAINLRLLNVLRKAHISFLILLICIVLHPLWNYIFIMHLDWEIAGSAIAFTIGRFCLFLLTTVYLWLRHPVPEANFSLNRQCFQGLGDYLKFSTGSALLMCAEWWPFELMSYLATYMQEVDYNVQIYAAQLNSLVFSLPVGISLATTIYISDYITKCDIKTVKRAAIYACVFAAACSSFVSLILFCLKSQILKIFTQNKEILLRGEGIVVFMCIAEVFDMIQFTFSSILRGLGKQSQASLMTLIQFYLVMMTLAYVFGIRMEMGVYGIWLAIIIGYATATVLYFLMLLCINWDKVKEDTMLRMERDDQKVTLLED